jgi:Lrp/AsnC family transcriptional regulator for asnA, asnC and gidA
VIKGSQFIIDPEKIGYETCAYIGLNLRTPETFDEVVNELRKIPEIVECHFTTGPYTMLVKLYARDNEQLMDLLNNQLQDIPGVVATETLISLEQSVRREIPIATE